jgi:site-specific recombinase XerD
MPSAPQQMYLDETKRTKSNGEPIANDSHHLLLRRIKHFYKWAVSRRYVTSNPFAEVSPIGRPRRGKQQLRIDEARKLVAAAMERAKTLRCRIDRDSDADFPGTPSDRITGPSGARPRR